MFSVIIPIKEITPLVSNNIRVLSSDPQIDQILLVNIGTSVIELQKNAKKIEIVQLPNYKVYDALDKTIDEFVIQDNIIILDNNIHVGTKFVPKLTAHFADNHLYTFKANNIFPNNSVTIDSRVGNRIKASMFSILAVAFKKTDANRIGLFDGDNLVGFANRMSKSGIKLQLLNQVLCHQMMNEKAYIAKESSRKVDNTPIISPPNTLQNRTNTLQNRTKGKIGQLRKKPKTELNEKRLMIDKGFINRDLTTKISIIIPLMVKGDRFNIFIASLDSLYNQTKEYSNIEIIVHETDTEKRLSDEIIDKYNIKYRFSYWDKPFHRSWALNVPAKHDAIGDKLVFFDADLIVTPTWVDALLKCKNRYYIGWGDIRYLSMENTDIYLKEGHIIDDYIVFLNRMTTRDLNNKSSFDIGCGGINVFPRQLFFDIKGWPENYAGLGYGGEDNSMNYKMLELGHRIDYFPIKIYHLYHGHTTEANNERFPIKQMHKNFSKKQWIDEINNIGDNWGNIAESMRSDLRVLWLTMDRSDRVANHFDDLRDTFCKYANVTVMTQHLHNDNDPNRQHEAYLSGKESYKPMLTGALNYDYIICDAMFLWMFEDWDNIHIQTAIIIEDQHGKVPERQIQHAIKYSHTVIHRYKFNKFHTDLSKKVKTIWLPHSVNINNFKDYGLRKEYGVLSTGLLANIYKTRSAVADSLKDREYFKRIERPLDYKKEQWPIQDGYSKELNKAWMSVCCSSILQYPVMKFFEIPASGSILYSDYLPELKELGFVPDKNMIQVNLNNIQGQVETLLKDEKRMQKVSAAGFKLIHDRHTNDIRAQELLHIIENECKTRIGNGMLDKICSKYKDILDKAQIIGLMGMDKPLVTIAMLSFKRFDVLISSLERHLLNRTPLNMVLRVQCCEDLTTQQKDKIIELVSRFHASDLQFTEKNLGSGIPRHDVINRALTKFNTPYILTTDDDMLWEPYSIIAQVSLLERLPGYGLISSVCAPNYPRHYKENNIWKFEQVIQDTFVDAHLIGSATSVYRREVFDTCEYDKKYTIGCGDYDLCMQIDKAGWKIGVLNIPELKSLNNNKGNTQEYRKMRYNKAVTKLSTTRFNEKWGILGIGGL